MGRFIIRGDDALAFLQHVLTNNAAALELEESQYTLIPNETGGAIDDAYLYRFEAGEYLLVVNAANRDKDWQHLQARLRQFNNVEIVDQTDAVAMLSLQGPLAKQMVLNLIDTGHLPEPMRNRLSTIRLKGIDVRLARTGYTGEPICFELFVARSDAVTMWEALVEQGAHPVGLGARDTLRLEAGLPLYGHELGEDPEGNEIPIFASMLARFAVSLSPLKKDFIGRAALETQFEAFKRIVARDFSLIKDLPRRIMTVALTEKGVIRAGYPVFREGKPVGFITSGTMVPYWETVGEGIASHMTGAKGLRSIGLALLNSDLYEGDAIEVDIRGKRTRAIIVPYHLRSEAPPYARAILWDRIHLEKGVGVDRETSRKVETLLNKTIANTAWRQTACINLIPSEQTPSAAVRLLSIMDPVGRYAEHKPVAAFGEADVFYYQGTEFIAEVETQLEAELRQYLGCVDVEARLVSGQMANMAVFSALVDYLNRSDRKSEQRRIRKVINNHIIKGGHLSAQPMGALRDFVARDPMTEKPAVVNFPVLEENPYKIDVPASEILIAEHRPELIIMGKSMTIHKEPVAAIRQIVDDLALNCVVMYDMAHVLGLVGPYFQEPFKEGADIVTGSTHKTYFGTQRGIIGSNYPEKDPHHELFDAIQRRAFPGSVSNHHLGTLLGLLLAAYEMNLFKDTYQQKVLSNAKAFARALSDCGLEVAGDAGNDFTETHQVLLNVGYAKGPQIAQRLEENNIIVNYQAAPQEEGFTASGSLRMGVQEMTRFGMEGKHFQELAQLICDVVKHDQTVKDRVVALRQRFLEMQYCFTTQQFEDQMQQLHNFLR
jgi:aminomethyltransferase